MQKDVGLEAVLHFPTRGRNLLRIQGDLLAAHAMGIRNLFVAMGDPTRIGDYPEAMDTYDIVPTGLMELIKKQFNQGLDKAGLSIDQPTTFVVGGALSLTPVSYTHLDVYKRQILKLANALIHQSDLHLRRTGVAFVHSKTFDQFGFLCHSQGHCGCLLYTSRCV